MWGDRLPEQLLGLLRLLFQNVADQGGGAVLGAELGLGGEGGVGAGLDGGDAGGERRLGLDGRGLGDLGHGLGDLSGGLGGDDLVDLLGGGLGDRGGGGLDGRHRGGDGG